MPPLPQAIPSLPCTLQQKGKGRAGSLGAVTPLSPLRAPKTKAGGSTPLSITVLSGTRVLGRTKWPPEGSLLGRCPEAALQPIPARSRTSLAATPTPPPSLRSPDRVLISQAPLL